MAGQLGNSAQSNILLLIFQNTNWANVGDATGLRGSTTAGSFYIQFHTANPGAGGNQSTSEAAYTNYARQAVARSGSGWTVTGSSPTTSQNAAAITFPQSGSSETETYASLGRAAAGTGELLWFGPLTSSLAIANLITPSFAINAFQCSLT